MVVVAWSDDFCRSTTERRNPVVTVARGSRSAVQAPFSSGVAVALVRSRNMTCSRGGGFLLYRVLKSTRGPSFCDAVLGRGKDCRGTNTLGGAQRGFGVRA